MTSHMRTEEKVKDDQGQRAKPAQMTGVNEPENPDSLLGICMKSVLPLLSPAVYPRPVL